MFTVQIKVIIEMCFLCHFPKKGIHPGHTRANKGAWFPMTPVGPTHNVECLDNRTSMTLDRKTIKAIECIP